MKQIGLIGGLSPESTVHYYQQICKGYNKRVGGHNFPEIKIESMNLQRIVDAMDTGDWPGVANYISRGILNLRAAGADFAAITTNTPHVVYDRISEEVSPFRVLSIMDAVGDEVEKYGHKKVALLGTGPTMRLGFYKEAFEKRGIEVIVPQKDERKTIERVIWDELVFGKIVDSSWDAYVDIIYRLKGRGAQGVILGCTEIPILISPVDSPIKVYDTTKIHANAILDYAMNA